MKNEYFNKASVVLDIIFDIVKHDGNPDNPSLPFEFREDGVAICNEQLNEKLIHNEDPELHDWAIRNLKNLF